MMDGGQRVDRVVQHVGARHRGDHAGAVHDGVERRRARRRSAPAIRIRATTARSRAGSPSTSASARSSALEFAIRSMTSLPALGVRPRRTAASSGRAPSPTSSSSIPRRSATRRPTPSRRRSPKACRDVLVNGVPVRLDGKFTDASPGRVFEEGKRGSAGYPSQNPVTRRPLDVQRIHGRSACARCSPTTCNAPGRRSRVPATGRS